MSLTKAHIVESLLKMDPITRTKAARLVESVFDIIKRELEKGEDILISRFGKFCIKDKAPRRGRNP